MKLLQFVISLVITVFFAIILNQSNPFGMENIPPLGQLMSPFQGFWQNAGHSADFDFSSKSFAELKEEVKVVYDDRLVPHIFASNLVDAHFAQGYVTAQHRLWQMDFATRAAAGMISEVVGPRALDYDKFQRRIGILQSAKAAVESWKKDDKNFALLEAYAAGVNAYIDQLAAKDYPVEYKLMGFAPTPWSPLRTALFARRMAQTLNFRHTDLATTNALQIFGKETFDFLYPERNPLQSPIIPDTVKWEFDPVVSITDTVDLIGEMFEHRALPMSPEGIGSNNWAVSGIKTANGHPILCNDPHLSLTLPAIWFEIQIHTPEINAYGVSLPGMPGIAIGFNENVAWGMTNVGQDVTDWYRIKWVDEDKQQYYFDGVPRKIQYTFEEIKVKGSSKPVIDTIRYTHIGPIVYDNDDAGLQDMAMRWVTLEEPKSNELESFLLLNKAKNYEDYSQALINYESPAQNFVFAAKDGDIALKVNGKFPAKKNQAGRFIEDGSTSQSQWQGFIPKEHIPQIKNPSRGFVASANQRSTGKDYPYYYNGGFDDYRGRIINRKLAEMENITVDDMKALQLSSQSILAEEGLPLLLKNLDRYQLSEEQIEMTKKLEDWNFEFSGTELTPVVFWEWLRNTYDGLWDEIILLQDSVEVLGPEWWRTLQMMERDTLSEFWDNKSSAEVERPAHIVTAAFQKTWQSLQEKRAEEADYDWQKHKATFIPHLARLAPFGRFDLPVGGFRFAPNAISDAHGPSWRMVVELGESINAFGVYPGGQSGNPGSPHYDDMVDPWVQGEYHQLWFMKDANEQKKNILFTQSLNGK